MISVVLKKKKRLNSTVTDSKHSDPMWKRFYICIYAVVSHTWTEGSDQGCVYMF